MQNSRSFIHIIPVELLCLIFEAAHSTSPNSLWPDEFPDAPKSAPVELVLSNVCRGWRYVVLSEPTLWSRIITTGKSKNSLIGAKTYLERSLNSDIDIHIHGQIDTEMLFAHFLPCIDRWRSLAVRSDSISFWAKFLESLRNEKAARLQYVEFSTGASYVDSEETRTIDTQRSIFTGGTPSLAVLNIKRLALHCCRPALAPRLSTVLMQNSFGEIPGRFIGHSQDNLTFALHGSSNITHLVFSGEIVNTFFTRGIIVTLLKLITLEVQCEDTLDTAGILTILRAPILECFHLRADSFAESFDALMRGDTFPSVRHLKVTSYENIQPSYWSTLWRFFPGVVEFTSSFDVVGSLADADTLSTALNWPGLQTLGITFNFDHAVLNYVEHYRLSLSTHAHVVATWIESNRRIDGVPPLRVLWLPEMMDLGIEPEILRRYSCSQSNDVTFHCAYHENGRNSRSIVDSYRY